MINLPYSITDDSAFPHGDTESYLAQAGMTYHQWLVGQALSGMSSEYFASNCDTALSDRDLAAAAISVANEVIKQLNRTHPPNPIDPVQQAKDAETNRIEAGYSRSLDPHFRR